METIEQRDRQDLKEHLAIKAPGIVSPQEWEAARQQLLVKEKAFTRSRDALAAERRRMPWVALEKNYEFEGPKGAWLHRKRFESADRAPAADGTTYCNAGWAGWAGQTGQAGSGWLARCACLARPTGDL